MSTDQIHQVAMQEEWRWNIVCLFFSPPRQVSRGANVFARADFGATILHAAATTGNVEGIQFALQNGVNVNVKGKTSDDNLLTY